MTSIDWASSMDWASVEKHIRNFTCAVDHVADGVEQALAAFVYYGGRTVCNFGAFALGSWVAGAAVGNFALSTAQKIGNMSSLFDGSMSTAEILTGAVDFSRDAAKALVNSSVVFHTEFFSLFSALPMAPIHPVVLFIAAVSPFAIVFTIVADITGLVMAVKAKIDELATGVDVQKNAWLAVLKTAAAIFAIASVITVFAGSFPLFIGFGAAALACKAGADLISYFVEADTRPVQR